MKTIILSIAIMLSGVLAFAQTDTTKIINQEELTFTQVYSDVKVGLAAIGEALKVGAEHVYSVLVKQQIVNSVSLTLVFIGGFILSWISIIKLSKLGWNDNSYYKSDWEDRGGKEAWKKEQFGVQNFIYIILGLVGLIMFLIPIFNINEIVMGYINPEYGAIMQIKSFIK